MSAVDEYHKFARDCLQWAAKGSDRGAAKAAAGLAHDWTQAASGLDARGEEEV